MGSNKPVLWGVLAAIAILALLPMWSVVAALLDAGSTFAAALGGLGFIGMVVYLVTVVKATVKKFVDQLQ